jgi:predicted aspartyl protease
MRNADPTNATPGGTDRRGSPAPSRRRGLRVAAGLALALTLVVGLSACSLDQINQPQVTTCGNGIAAPVTIKSDRTGATLVIAAVMLQGHGPYQFAIDTGASVSIVDTTVAKEAGLAQAGRSEPITGVGGAQDAIPVRVTAWSIGEIRLPPVLPPVHTIAALSLPDAQRANGFVGLLGSDVLSQFGAVTVNYSTSTPQLIVYQQIVPAPTVTPGGVPGATPQAHQPRAHA